MGVGRQAARGELRGRRAQPRLHRRGTAGDQPHRRARLSRADAAGRRVARARRVVRPARHRTVPRVPRRGAEAEAARREAAEERRRRPREGADEGQHARGGEAHRGGRRPAADRRRPAAHRADRAARPDRPHVGSRRTTGCEEVLASYQTTLQQQNHPMREFSYVHMARKVVGVGSVGTRAWIVLLEGRDDVGPAAAAGQAGRGVGAGAVPAAERVRQPRRAGGASASG